MTCTALPTYPTPTPNHVSLLQQLDDHINDADMRREVGAVKKQARGMRLHRLPKPKWRWAIELESSEDGEMLEDIDDALIMQGANLFRAGCFAVMFLARLVQVSLESAALVFFCDPPIVQVERT